MSVRTRIIFSFTVIVFLFVASAAMNRWTMNVLGALEREDMAREVYYFRVSSVADQWRDLQKKSELLSHEPDGWRKLRPIAQQILGEMRNSLDALQKSSFLRSAPPQFALSPFNVLNTRLDQIEKCWDTAPSSACADLRGAAPDIEHSLETIATATWFLSSDDSPLQSVFLSHASSLLMGSNDSTHSSTLLYTSMEIAQVLGWTFPIFAILVASTVGILTSRHLIRGTSTLIHASRKIAAGDYSVVVPVASKDEFAEIGTQFNAMVEMLDKAQQRISQQTDEIRKQQELAESLLLNVLPSDIASELKEKGAVDPRYHEDVTILFTDFKGFTLATENLPAEELVKALHEYFTAFDTVIQRYGLEKLKTIGDSYMAVAGLPERRASHAVDAILAAFAIVDAVLAAHERGLPPWSIRIGVHTGPVVSGVVGIRKFAFDIWGESVNFASRMESSGAPNRVNLSASTYVRVKDFFDCEHRGKVPTKEGREFDMYFAVGPLSRFRQSGDVVAAFASRYRSYFQQELANLPNSFSAAARKHASNI